MRVGGMVPVSYPGNEGVRRAGKNVPSEEFRTQMTDAVQAEGNSPAMTLHNETDETGAKAVSAWADLESGTSTTVYKPQDFDPANPVYRVKTWDSSGRVTERMVDISKVNPRSADTIEMFAYAAHLQESGDFQGALQKFMAAKSQSRQNGSGQDDFSQKINWVEVVREITQSQYDIGNLQGYLEWKMFQRVLEGKGSN